MSLVNCDPPRWPGGPPICRKANRPAFADGVDAGRFFATIPSVVLEQLYGCTACGGFHAHSHLAGTGGDRSDTLHLPRWLKDRPQRLQKPGPGKVRALEGHLPGMGRKAA